MNRDYRWINSETGEVCMNIFRIVKSMWLDIKHLKKIEPYMFKWERYNPNKSYI